MDNDNNAKKNSQINPAFGNRIRLAREEHGLTVRELSQVVGCSPAQLTRLELANRRASNVRLIRNLSEALHIPYDELAILVGPEYSSNEGSLIQQAFPSVTTATQEKAIGEFASIISKANLTETQLAQLVEIVKGMANHYEHQNEK